MTHWFLACTWQKERQASVLLIAVDALAFDHALCSRNLSEESISGMRSICEESVRFTHAYTPSVLSQPALASLMTARYPHEHGVWNNGPKFLSAKFVTVPEVAVRAGYRTAFFSGGAPIWSFSGLNQGFELFSDYVPLRHDLIYRPAEKSLAQLLRWLERGDPKKPFFSVVYLADLQFPEQETVNHLGEVRPKNFESQWLEVDEALGLLIRQLKARGQWNSTHVILAGLNGVTSPQKPSELKSFNLFSSNAEVALYIKPAGKKRDLGIQWKIDKNVSLVDVGATLYGMVGSEPPAVPGRTLEITSLQSVLQEPTAHWSADRLILTESAWAQWLGIGNSRFAARVGHLLFLHDAQLEIYNTFVDYQEVSPLSDKPASIQEIAGKVMNHMKESNFDPWLSLSGDLVDKWQIGSEIFSEREVSTPLKMALEGVLEKRPWDDQIIGWLASLATSGQKWRELKKLATRTKKSQWLFFAQRALQENPAVPVRGCLALFRSLGAPLSRPSLKECDDQLFVSLMMWLSRKNNFDERDMFRARFLRRYYWHSLDQTIYRHNVRNHLLWNVDVAFPGGPDLVELTLRLPEFSTQREQAMRELQKL